MSEETPIQRLDVAGPIPACNLCGEPCGIESHGMACKLGLIDAVVSGGYDSTPGNGDGALDDGSIYRFSLCEFCLNWLFTRMRLPPTVWYHGTDEAFVPAERRVREDDWRRMKARFFAENDRRAALREAKP